MRNSSVKKHGNFEIPVTDLRESFAYVHDKRGDTFPNLSYEELFDLIDLCTISGEDQQTEANYLELMDYLVQNGVKMSAIHAKVRLFSDTTKAVAMRLCAEQVRNRRNEQHRSLVFSSTSASASAVVA